MGLDAFLIHCFFFIEKTLDKEMIKRSIHELLFDRAFCLRVDDKNYF